MTTPSVKLALTNQVAVLGSGGWGTALAVHLGHLGKDVRLWGRNEKLVTQMAEERENAAYLPGVRLPDGVAPTNSLADALAGTPCIVSAVPSHGTRQVLRMASAVMTDEAVVVSATKGLEGGTLLRMSEVMDQELGSRRTVTVLSGPSFSAEFARGLPTAVSIAGRSAEAVAEVQEQFRSPCFRLYATEDVVGVEIGGAMKNVIAIAAGVVEGLGLGHNALSALITRGLAETSRLASVVGGRRDTLAGLSGLGDLVLTCTGAQSRNRRVGVELGQGRSLDQILADMSEVAEGVRTTEAALDLGRRHAVEMPITTQMAEVLSGRSTPRAAVEELMLRRQRSEAEIGR